jgi:hypothetical protein
LNAQGERPLDDLTRSPRVLARTSNYETLKAVSKGLKEFGASFGFVPTLDSARDYIGRHKIDGIFVDLEVAGSQELIGSIGQGTCNRNAVVFACVPSPTESPITLVSEANFLLQKLLSVESVLANVAAAKDNMARERRRYFRHIVRFPVIIAAGGTEQQAIMTNLSEGAWPYTPQKQSSVPRSLSLRLT